MQHLISSIVLAVVVGVAVPASAGATSVRGPATVSAAATSPNAVQDARRPMPQPVLVVADLAGLQAAADLLEAAASAGVQPAGLCLPADDLAGAAPTLGADLAARLRPALDQHATPACLLVRPAAGTGPSAGASTADHVRQALTGARDTLGADLPVAEVRLDLSDLAPAVEQAAAETALVAGVVPEIVPEARLRVVLGTFAGIDAARPSGASAYLAALERWHQASRSGSGRGVEAVDLAVSDLPPQVAALGQEWLRAHRLAPGIQVSVNLETATPGTATSGAATPGATAGAEPDAAGHSGRPFLQAGGVAEHLALRVTLPPASAPVGASSVEPATGSPGASPASLPAPVPARPGAVTDLGSLLWSLDRQFRTGLLPRAELHAAPLLALPGLPLENDNGERYAPETYPADSNSPAHWSGDTLHLFTSVGQPRRSEGRSLYDLGPAEPVRVRGDDADARPMRWLEATYKAPDGTLYGWYHEEPADVCPEETNRPDVALTAPRIGAMSSENDGERWHDLGIVLEAPRWSIRCHTPNHYFAGGVGDFAVIPDQAGAFLYFVFSSYGPEPDQQGIGVARIDRRDLDDPVGAVWRWGDGGWTAPGLGGRGAMLYPAVRDWHRADASAFWGPSVHWNTHLNQYVILLNRAGDADWGQAGAYVAFAERLDSLLSWTVPQKLRDGGDWYVQAIGTDAARRETDTLIGQTARYFEHGASQHTIVFRRPGE